MSVCLRTHVCVCMYYGYSVGRIFLLLLLYLSFLFLTSFFSAVFCRQHTERVHEIFMSAESNRESPHSCCSLFEASFLLAYSVYEDSACKPLLPPTTTTLPVTPEHTIIPLALLLLLLALSLSLRSTADAEAGTADSSA